MDLPPRYQQLAGRNIVTHIPKEVVSPTTGVKKLMTAGRVMNQMPAW